MSNRVLKIWSRLISNFHINNPRKNTRGLDSESVQTYMIQVILLSTFIVTITLNLLLLISFFVLHNHQVSYRIIIGFCVLFYVSTAAFLLRLDHLKKVAWMLVFLYTLIAILVLISWGINTPIGILLLGLVVILSGVMLGAKVIIPISIALLILLITIQVLTNIDAINADRLWLARDSNFGDVLGYTTILGVFALLAWLSRRQIEQALRQALDAEAALQIEKNSLAIKVEEITRSLRDAQLKEMQQLYRFAELGQLTAIILHDLANHLSVLTLDIEELQGKGKKSTPIKNAMESIDYLEVIVKDVRAKLNENSESKRFDVIEVTRLITSEFAKKSSRSNIEISYKNISIKRTFFIDGDSLKLSQCMTILINNAIEACLQKRSARLKMHVEVSLKYRDNKLFISIKDNGIGISKSRRNQLFKPLKSKKKNGLGIGLYITRQIVETQFQGTLTLDPSHDYTKFIVAIPSIQD